MNKNRAPFLFTNLCINIFFDSGYILCDSLAVVCERSQEQKTGGSDMKVCITKDTKKWLTLEQLPKAKTVIASMKEDEWSAKEYIDMAANCWLKNAENGDRTDRVRRVLFAEAEVAGNNRVWDAFCDTGTLDVWLRGVVETYNGFLKIGCYLTDIWNIGPEEFNRDFPSHTYTRYFTEKRKGE